MSGLFKIIVIAGPIGAGKTTFAKTLFPHARGVFVYLNADEIARALSLTAVGAGREMLRLIDHHVGQRDDIMLETTLAGQNYLRRIPDWQPVQGIPSSCFICGSPKRKPPFVACESV